MRHVLPCAHARAAVWALLHPNSLQAVIVSHVVMWWPSRLRLTDTDSTSNSNVIHVSLEILVGVLHLERVKHAVHYRVHPHDSRRTPAQPQQVLQKLTPCVGFRHAPTTLWLWDNFMLRTAVEHPVLFCRVSFSSLFFRWEYRETGV
jgi:hypothetical protein